MKRALYIMGIALAAIGCTKSDTTTTLPSDGAISFTAGVVTRVLDSDDCKWSTTDVIGIFTNQTNDSQNMTFTISDTSTGEMSSSTVLYPLSSSDERTYYAYHPHDENLTASATTISYDLTTGYSKYLLYATTITNDSNVALQFIHQLPKVTFNLIAGGTEATTLEGATAWLAGATSAAKFDIESGGFTDEKTENISLSLDNSHSVTAYLLPTASGKAKLWVTTANGYKFVKTFTESWESGSSYNYTITVGESETN